MKPAWLKTMLEKLPPPQPETGRKYFIIVNRPVSPPLRKRVFGETPAASVMDEADELDRQDFDLNSRNYW